MLLFREYGPDAPDELQLDCTVLIPPGGAPGTVSFGVCYSGPEASAERALSPLRALGEPLAEETRRLDYAVLQRSGDISDPRAQANYTKSGFVNEIPERLIEAALSGFEGHPNRMTQIFIQQGGGAISRVASDATAFPQRSALGNMLAMVGWRFGDDSAEHVRWIQDYWSRIEPFTDGFYVNDVEDGDTTAAVRDTYRQNHARLVAVKNRYDPRNLFRLNANILPTV